ncbi:MAG: His/Gly/Thr/Pro-type tRNA ligase C-terminal domain-containing protein, partial [Candidatus Micrarchaeota archaeon]|nr:His/Gly/Thr/Pro-type tRNA ligase C-terminal domain-containing protein [Candidatus Micrarchaeota archaeon]
LEEEHFRGFESEVFWVTRAGLNELEERYVLRPTSETAIYPMYSLWIKGVRDLPIKYYISGTVWRYETKSTRPLIRGREFLWIETHDAFRNEREARDQIYRDLEISNRVLRDKLRLDFLMLRRPVWDRFAGAVDTYAVDTLLPDGKVLQIATTHYLGENFARVFNVKYMDSDEREKYVHQTCFGIGINRIFASVMYIHADALGLRLPSSVSPYQFTIIPIGDVSKEYIEKVYNEYRDKYRISLDTREGITPGNKFYYWDRKGVPLKILVGKKEESQNTITIGFRDGTKETIPLGRDLDTYLERFDQSLVHTLKIHDAQTLEDVGRILEAGGIARAPFYSIDREGEEYYRVIKERYRAEIRGVRIDREERPEGKCIVSGRDAEVLVYIAKQY